MRAKRKSGLAARADRTSRSLTALQRTASTSRVLNLLAIANKHARKPEWTDQPLFHNRVLNASMILKHRLRLDESYLFDDYRTSATKVIIPFERSDLALGGRSFFVGQRGWMDLLREACADGRTLDHDVNVLRQMDGLPSLDPFLLREDLRRNGQTVAPCYFAISPADLEAMQAYVAMQIGELIRLAYVNAGQGAATARLVQALLSTDVDERLEPLRATLMLQGEDFREGVFSWKGFLYYKWMLMVLQPQLTAVTKEIGELVISGPRDMETAAYLDCARDRIRRAISSQRAEVNRTLAVYDKAFTALTQRSDPKAFRAFLLDAPRMFLSLGEKVGQISHIASFWRYRFPAGRAPTATVDEVVDIFQDFETGLGEPLEL
ncbi:MAG: hypothetical protein HY859_12565 [Caulobacterales bacterium]|nr:hypothetical protein [Caulobacterales bacterium]